MKPTSGQIINAMKYSSHYFTNSFPYYLNYNPISVGFYITYKCNIKCPHCFSTAINKKEYLQETMSLEEFESIVTHRNLIDTFRVSFVGGEPLLHPDLFKMIELCTRHQKLTMFPSNGLVVNERLDEFKKTSLTTIQISLYDNYIEKQMKNAALIRKANPGIEVSLSRIVTKERESYLFMEEVIKMAKGLGLENICFQNFVAKDKTHSHLSIYEEDEDVLQYLKEIKSKYGREFNILFPAPLSKNAGWRFCYDFYTVVFVRKGGVITPCSTVVPPYKMPQTIYDDNFWNTKSFLDLRKNHNSTPPFDSLCDFCYKSARYTRAFI